MKKKKKERHFITTALLVQQSQTAGFPAGVIGLYYINTLET